MKQLFKSLFLVASIAASLISCQKEQNSPEVKEAVKLTVHAKAENLNGDTKTYIDGKQVLWGTGEYMTAALVSGGDFAVYKSNDNTTDWSGETEAYFEFDVDLSADPVTYGGIYPTSAVVDGNKIATSFKVELSAAQKASATSYDPSAYIMIAKPETFTEITTEWEASFRRATALNKITLTNLEDNITSVKITVPADKYLAGRRYMDLTTGDKGEIYNGGGRTNALTINYTTPIASNVEAKDIWFTSWGVEIPEDAKMTVVAYSDKFSYTRDITARAGGINFNEGFLNTLSINMASAVKESIEKLEGDYAVLVAQNDVYYILSSTNTISSTRLDAVEFTGYEADTEYTSETPLQIVDPNFVWTISCDENSNYNFKNGEKYLSFSGESKDNTAEVSETPYALMITEEDGGTYNVSSFAIAGKRLAKNTTNNYFAFYTGTQEKELILVPARYVRKATAPEINYEKTTSTVTITAEEGASVYYTTDGTNPTESSTKVEYTEPFTLTQSATVKAYATLEDCLDSDVASKECVVGQNTPKYVKVAASKEDWSGTYLIVSGTTAFTGTISTTSTKYGQIATVTVSNDAIESTTTIDGYKVFVEKSGDHYTIKTNSNNYLYWSSGNSLNANTTLQQDNKSLWDFTFNDGGTVSITNANTTTRVIRFNSDRFACYTTDTGSIPNLYELEDNRTSQTLTFTAEEGTVDLNGNVQNLPSLNTDGAHTTVTYSSSDESVATVDPNAGTVTAIKVGTAKITATAAESSTYKKATASYNLTVSDSTPIINASNPAAVEASATSIDVPYTVVNSVVGKSLSVTIPEDASWITSSNVTDSKVTLTITQNAESSQRSAVITLSYEGATSKEVTVKQSGAPATAYTSLAELYAAGLTSGTTVTAILTNEVITEVVTKGLCFDAGGNKVEIYGNAAFPTEWGDVKVGGYISGTVTCTWSYYEKGSIWELMPTGWSAFTYKAPCATPEITLDGANATITCTTTGATILYEIADSKPANFTNTYNGSPIALSDGQTIWAKATREGYPDSEVTSRKYTAGSTVPPAGTELFFCDFGTTNIALASYTGGRSYKDESTISYTASDASIVKITTDSASNMESANLYFNTKTAGAGYSATIAGIKTHGATKVKVTWAANNAYTTLTLDGSSDTGQKSANSASNSKTFTLNSGVTTISVVFTSNGKSNTRVDNVKVEVAD